MNNWTRFLSTLVVWFMYAGVVAGSMAMAMSPSFDEEWIIPVVVLLVTIVAGYTSHAIWRFPQQENQSSARADQERTAAKNKRGDRLARLVDDLSEDEIVELETLLLSRDGEDYRR